VGVNNMKREEMKKCRIQHSSIRHCWNTTQQCAVSVTAEIQHSSIRHCWNTASCICSKWTTLYL